MKTTETKIPHLDSLVSELKESQHMDYEEMPAVEIQQPEDEPEKYTQSESNGKSTLWNELMVMLESSKEITSAKSQKIYKIDSDIVETLAQCRFKKHSISHVVNCILRTYIIANIHNLDGLRKHEPSLFDNYLTK